MTARLSPVEVMAGSENSISVCTGGSKNTSTVYKAREKFYFTFPLDPHLQSAEMGHGWWQRGCVGSSWLLKVRDRAGSQTWRRLQALGCRLGMYWDKRWPGAEMVA